MTKLTILFGLAASLAAAQTTYTDPGPSHCLGASHYPPETAYSFQCDSSGSIVFQGNQVEFYGSHVMVSVPAQFQMSAWGDMTAITGFVAPAGCSYRPGVLCTTSGSLSFTWEEPGTDGLTHTGSFSATVNGTPDWRGWFHPILTDIVLTVN